MQPFSSLPSDSPLIFRFTSSMYLGAFAARSFAVPGCFRFVLWRRIGCLCTELVGLDMCKLRGSQGVRHPERRQIIAGGFRQIAASICRCCDSAVLSWSGYALPHCEKTHILTVRKEIIMSESRGPVRFSPLFTTDDIGLSNNANIEHIIKVFLIAGEGIAARWIEMPEGVLLLQTVPGEPASGAIYLYDRQRRVFFFVDFARGRDDNLTAPEFDQLVAEYDLVSWAAKPGFLRVGGYAATA